MIKRGLLLVLCLSFMQISFAQKTHTVKGYVKDKEGSVIGATVWLIGTHKGTTTNANGYYELKIQDVSNPVIGISYIGKKTIKIPYKGEKSFNQELEDDVRALDEVKVTAKTNINEIDIRARTGNVDVVNITKLKNSPVSSITIALQGKTPGLQIINQGELGVLPKIRIRGTSSLRRGNAANEPLYILDGKMISAETFFYLNPENIREMKVLKDAVACAIYGIKAANGVIEITSKRGSSGNTLNFHAQSGITLKTPLRVELMNSAEKLELERLLKEPIAPGYLYSEDYISRQYGGTPSEKEKLLEGERVLDSLRNINTDWYKEFSRIETYQKYDLNYSDGDEKTSYFISLGYLHQGGQLKGNDFSRVSTRVGLDKNLSEKAIATLSIDGSYAKTNTPNGNGLSPAELTYKLNPYETKDSKHLYSHPERSFNDLFNQFSRVSTSKNVGSSVSLNWKINPNLDISSVAGIDFSLSENLNIVPETATAEIKEPKNARGTLSQSKNTTTNITANIRVNYTKNIGKHEITLGANADNYTTLMNNLNVTGHGLYGKLKSATAVDNSLTGNRRSLIGGLKQTNRDLGFGALVGYTYNKTYNLFATYKLDASSVLPVSKRWNAAWALGASINMKGYTLLKEWLWLSAFDIRCSIGNTANSQGISPSLIRATFKYLPKNYDGTRIMRIKALPNQELRAEQNKMIDVGFSAKIYKTSFHLSAYRRITVDALLNIPIASSSGFLNQLQNIGVLENRGIEFGCEQQLFARKNWNIRLGGNMSYNENKVLDLYNRERIYILESNIIPDYEEGKSTDAFYGLNSTGINPITGLPEFIDRNNEQFIADSKLLTRDDFIYLGKSTPPINGSIFINVGYKRLQVSMDFYYNMGGVRAYSEEYIRSSEYSNLNAAKAQLEDMWWQIGDENKKYPTPFHVSNVDYTLDYPSNKTIVKTDFIRFSNLSVKYQIASEQIAKVTKKIRYITLGINASNLFTLSGFKESDPETRQIISPLPPIITFNLNITF